MVVVKRFGVVFAAAALLVSLSLLSPGSVTAQSVTIDPGAASAGAQATASGSGWAPGIRVRVEWSDGRLLGEVSVDTTGAFTTTFAVPATATPGDYQVRFVGYVPPYVEDCVVDAVRVPFEVVPFGTIVTPVSSTATATATATSDAVTTATAIATVCGAPTEDATETATDVATEPVTKTATSTATATATNTATATATATATRTPTRVATRTPTRVVYPGTGSGGLLDQGGDDDNGSSMPLILAAVVLGAGVTSAGVVVLRRRMA